MNDTWTPPGVTWIPPGIHRNFGSEFTARDLDKLRENNTKRYYISEQPFTRPVSAV
jgi:hypothetical protein